MRGELTNLPIDTLLDIVFVILSGGRPLTLSELGELDQIQRELQRRGEFEGARLSHRVSDCGTHDSSNLTQPMISGTAPRMLRKISVKLLH
jgi:hypothetical protein